MYRGVNFGSWLNPEGYLLGGRNISNHIIRGQFIKTHGKEEYNLYERLFRQNYIREDDFARVAGWGANVIRLPFHYRLLEDEQGNYLDNGFDRLKWSLDMAQKYGLNIILDFHAVCGAQNNDWHSDSDGVAHFWDKIELQDKTIRLWTAIVDMFKNHPAILGYDLLNEPVLGDRNIKLLQNFYKNCITEIRKIDTENIIYLEGHNWSQDIDCLADLVNEKNQVSIHFYQPIQYVFNFRRNYFYPGFIEGEDWSIDKIYSHLEKYKKFADKFNTNIQVGEFGVNFRKNSDGEVDYLDDVLTVFNDYGFDWTYWTYKGVAHSGFPDGILQYNHNPAWICREGPNYGLENLTDLWNDNKDEIVKSYLSSEFEPATKIVEILKNKFK